MVKCCPSRCVQKMNLLLLTADECTTPDEIRLDDRRARHVHDVLRARPGDSLRVGQINGRIGTAEVLAVRQDEVRLRCHLDQLPPPKLPLTIILALPRPKMLRRILRTIAELGIPELWLINTWKVEKSYWQSPLLEPAACRAALLEGLEQARDTVLPELYMRRFFKPFVEDELTAMLRGRPLLAHPAATQPCPAALAEPATLLVGPEGGLTHYEYTRLLEYGFESIHLGRRILRVETALTALVSRLYALP